MIKHKDQLILVLVYYMIHTVVLTVVSDVDCWQKPCPQRQHVDTWAQSGKCTPSFSQSFFAPTVAMVFMPMSTLCLLTCLQAAELSTFLFFILYIPSRRLLSHSFHSLSSLSCYFLPPALFLVCQYILALFSRQLLRFLFIIYLHAITLDFTN